MSESSKKRKISVEGDYFTKRGETADEIILMFEDEKKLYVSTNFLIYASPVFRAMFQHEFKESVSQTVHMKDKSYDDVLEFLLCLHPNVLNPVDDDNMMRVLSLANEYQVKSLINICKNRMKPILLKELHSAYKDKSVFPPKKCYREAAACLLILKAADMYDLDEIVKLAVAVIANFGYQVFSGSSGSLNRVRIERSESKSTYFQFSQATDKEGKMKNTAVQVEVQQTKPSQFHCSAVHIFDFGVEHTQGGISDEELRNECIKLYESLPMKIRYMLLSERLQNCDDSRFSL